MGQHSQIKKRERVARPFIWPELPRAQAVDLSLDGLLPAHAQQTNLQFGDIALTISGPVTVADGATKQLLRLRINDDILMIWSTDDLLELALLANNYPAEVEDYASDAHAIILEHLAHPILTSLADHFDTKAIEVVDLCATADTPSAPAFGLTVTGFTGRPFKIVVAGSRQLLTRVATMFDQEKKGKRTASLAAVPMQCCLRVPDIELDQSDFANLAQGDALLLDPSWLDPNNHTLHVVDGPWAKVASNDNALTLIAAFQTRPRSTKMPTQNKPDSALSDAPVTISIELARKEVNLGDIMSLEAGTVLPFETDDLTKVVLTANGQHVAFGDLVEVDDRVAIRLTDVS